MRQALSARTGLPVAELARADSVPAPVKAALGDEASPGAPFDQYGVSGSRQSDCTDDLPGSLFTTGPVEFWCRHVELAHLQTGGDDKQEQKFVGFACGRGADVAMAQHNAAASVRVLICASRARNR